MNFNSQPPAKNNVWQQFKKLTGNQPVRTEMVEIVSACSFIQQFQGSKGPYRREMLELSLALVGQDGKLTDSMIVKKIKGANITEDGQTGECPIELWDVLKLASVQNPNFLNQPQDGIRMGNPCRYYPNMNGVRFMAVFATTGSYNGYFVNSVEVFDPKTKFSGLEINNKATAPKAIEDATQKITEDHDRFAKTMQTATGGFGGWNGQQQQQPQQPQGGFGGFNGNPNNGNYSF